MKRMLLVVNPYSGQKKAAKMLAEIVGQFNRANYAVQVYITGGPGDAIKEVARLCNEVDLVVCCGGDGTFNETLSGLLSAESKTPIGYIPTGSTNDFASSLKLPLDVLEATKNIIEGQPVPYDAGRFGGRVFSYVASFGAFTRTSYTTPQSIKNALGHTAYVLEGIQELTQIRNEHIKMIVDGEVVEDDFLFGAICNSTSVGGVLTLDPDVVDLQDNKLEILLVRAPRNLAELHECILALQDQTYNCAMLTFRSATHIRIFADPEMPWTLDGEREEGHSEVEVVPEHLAYRLMKRVQL